MIVLEGFEMTLVGRFDPHMARFRDKLLARLGTPVLVG